MTAEREECRSQVERLQEQLRSVCTRLSATEERERRRLAADLHDRIGQTLAACKMKLGSARAAAGPGDVAELLADLAELLDGAIRDTRSLEFELCPPVLYELGLEAALQWLSEEVQTRHGLTVRYADDRRPKPLTDDVRGALFRAASELFGNVVKHAAARTVRVSVRKIEESVQVEVEDDGRGFDPDAGRLPGTEDGGFGLFSIRQRIESLGGSVSVDARPNRGTRVVLTAPLHAAK